MYLIYADEADLDGQKEFHVFGAVFFPSDKVKKICGQVQKIREKYGFESEDDLKFSTGTRPESVSRELHSKAKNEMIACLSDYQCQTCCYVTPSAIAKNQEVKTRIKFAVNTLLLKFDAFLSENGDQAGAVKFDRTTDFKQENYFKQVLAKGLTVKNRTYELQNIVSIDTTQNGLSHLCSLTDVVVGAYRFAVNEPQKDKVGRILLNSLSHSMWHRKDDNGVKRLRDWGLIVRPKKIERQEYAADVAAFTSRFEKYVND